MPGRPIFLRNFQNPTQFQNIDENGKKCKFLKISMIGYQNMLSTNSLQAQNCIS